MYDFFILCLPAPLGAVKIKFVSSTLKVVTRRKFDPVYTYLRSREEIFQFSTKSGKAIKKKAGSK